MKILFTLFLVFVFIPQFSISQVNTDTLDKYPVFPNCENLEITDLKDCFEKTVRSLLFSNFETPNIVTQEKYKGTVTVLFEVDTEGNFKVIYTDAIYKELKEAVETTFKKFPKITPSTYNGKPTYNQFTMPFIVPLEEELRGAETCIVEAKKVDAIISKEEHREFEAIKKFAYENEEYKSHINIPFSHHNYSLFDPYMNQVGTNSHTAEKPYLYSEVNMYYNFETENQKILKKANSWLGRKWWNEHMVALKGEDYWFTLDPGVDLQAGKDFGGDINTYNNTRLVYAQGGIGKQINFFATIFESQGRFADYFNRYAESIRPDGGNPAIIPGRGIAKRFREDSYDYPFATGHVSYKPSKYFNIQLGHGQNFIGDGYRSFLLSDNASPYPFFKVNTTFWKLKYTNTWMSLRDVRPEVTESGSFRTKFMANHYLSYNVTKRLNIGLFESVIWENDNDRGFDFNYLNPVIFYRAIEFSTGSRGGNALIGLTSKYKFSNRFNAYGQLIIDEFSSGAIFAGDGGYQNKIGYQLGGKYYDAFGLKNLYLQAEYNRVRPYTYSHNTIVLNYGHNNQSMAHTLGANFSEFIALARYQKGRWFGDAKFIVAKRGFEFNTEEDSFFYGSDIYGTGDDRISDNGNEVAQGNTADFFHAEIQAGYLINPATNLKVYASFIYRDLNPLVNTPSVFKEQTTWLNFGIRTDLFNWYYDF